MFKKAFELDELDTWGANGSHVKMRRIGLFSV